VWSIIILYWQTMSHAERGKSWRGLGLAGIQPQCRAFSATAFLAGIRILNFGGIYWTKFECILLIILTINDARLVRSLWSREQKPKIFLTFLLFFGGGCGGSRQKMERKFLVLLRRYLLHYTIILVYNVIGSGILVDMKSESAKLGKNLKRIRTEKGITQGDIVRTLGVSRSFVSNIENGKTNPTLSTISNIAKALSVSTDELLK